MQKKVKIDFFFGYKVPFLATGRISHFRIVVIKEAEIFVKYVPFFVDEVSLSDSSSSWSASSWSSSTSSSSSGMPLMKRSCFSALIGDASTGALVLCGNDNEQRGIVFREVDKLIRCISLLDRKYRPSPYLVNEKLEMPLEKDRKK